jgi:hypothetical protein
MTQYILNNDGSELEMTYEDYRETNEETHPQTEAEFRALFDSAIETLYNQKDFYSLERLRDLAVLLASDDTTDDRTFDLFMTLEYLNGLKAEEMMYARAFVGALSKHSE